MGAMARAAPTAWHSARTGGCSWPCSARVTSTVLRPDGSAERRIQLLGNAPTNVAFGLNGENRIYVTEDQLGQLTAHDVDGEGLALYA